MIPLRFAPGILLCVILGALNPLSPAPAQEAAPAAGPLITVTLENLSADLQKQEAAVKRNVIQSVRLWTDVIEAHPSCSLEVVFRVADAVDGDPAKLGFGKSRVSEPFNGEKINGKGLCEQGMAAELRTGRDPNGTEPDIEICLQAAYVRSQLWWDPEPEKRRRRIPPGKLDALSVLLHETGHALAFNGWLDQKTGAQTGPVLSTYDRHVILKDGEFFFNGPEALKAWRGKPVPLAKTNNNYHHTGDKRAGLRTPPVLKEDLMTGYDFAWQFRYRITPLDIAILKDCGIRVKKKINAFHPSARHGS